MGLRRAVIDMGTNTFHLLVAEADAGAPGGLRVLHEDRAAVKLGQGAAGGDGAAGTGISRGRLATEAMARALEALRRFADAAAGFGIAPGDVVTVATSAMRTAANGQELAWRIHAETGLHVRVLAGRQEAAGIFAGIQASGALSGLDGPGLVMDIGGGSVEFSIGGAAGPPLWLGSFEVGAQRLLDQFMTADPIPPAQVAALRAYLDERLAPLAEACARLRPQALIGASGSFDTLRELRAATPAQGAARPQPGALWERLPPGYTEGVAELMLTLPKAGRASLPGMAALRVDMIVVALQLAVWVLRRCGISQVRAAGWALKEGIMLGGVPPEGV